MTTLNGKTAIVTGASRGLGSSMALELARQGASVLITYTSDSSTPKVQHLLSQMTSTFKVTAYSVKADLSKPSAPTEILAALDTWLGPDARVDILVNNAGVEVQKPVQEMTPEDFATVYDVNVRAPTLLTGALVPRMNPGGRIINIGSVGGRNGMKNLGLYCSSKAALEGLTRCWAAELGGNGTTVNQVNPGPVESDMLDQIPKEIVDAQKKATAVENRVGTPGEVANVVAWLASPAASWMSGQTLSVSGGCDMY